MNRHETEIHPLSAFDRESFLAIATGYMTSEMYRVVRFENDQETSFSLNLEHLPEPATYSFPFDNEELDQYTRLVDNGFCWGAYDGERLIGVAVAEPRWWNKTHWVREFHVASAYQHQGIGRKLMRIIAQQAKEAGLRALACETQNTNVAAIRFYRKVGFMLDGVDISYYTNDDTLPGRTVAVFMKLKFDG
jgi:streptothricin acetyltransferase